VTRIGVKAVLIVDMSMLTLGLLSFTQVSVGGSYWADLFPGFLILAVGLAFAFVPITIAGPSALTEGLVNAFWAGAAFAFAGVLVSIFLVRGRDLRVTEPVVSDEEPALEAA
jgi:hypothetical protein